MKNKWIVVLFFFLCGLLIPAADVSAQGHARALVVSRGDYAGRENDLSPGPENDGENFCRILSQAYGEEIDIVSLEKGSAQSVKSLTQVIRDTYADSDADDVNYFFYSGHGGPQGMMLESNEYLSAKSLAQAFSDVKGTNFLVFDCCYSGNLITRDFQQESFMDLFVREFRESLSNMKSRSAITNNSFHVLAASEENELSMQSQMGDTGPVAGFFTCAVSAGCGVDFTKVSRQDGYSYTAMADGNRDGNITLDELYHYVRSVLHASHATVWPEEDSTVFIPIRSEQIPRTSICDVQITRNEDNTPVLDISYSSEEDGTFQAALYHSGITFGDMSGDLEKAIIMTVNPEVTSYPYQDTNQAVSWTFSANAGQSSVSLPLGITDIQKGDYFLLINEKGGNTGCYLFSLRFEQNISATEKETITLQAADNYSIENDEAFSVEINLGNNASSVCYLLPITCTITDRFGRQVFTESVHETETIWTGESYSHFCRFVWNGTREGAGQVAAGTYTLTVLVGSKGSIQTMQHKIQVESLAEESPEYSSFPGEFGDVSGIFSISRKTIYLSAEQFVYCGMEICPEVSIDGLLNGYDYIVSYRDNIDAGTASVRIMGIGRYTGSVTKTYRILSVPLSNVSVQVQKSLKYTGKKCQAKTTLRYLRHKLKKGKDYAVSYKNNTNPGYAKVIIQGKGNYNGRITRKFKIMPVAPKSLKVKSTGAETRTLYWKKSMGVDGYKLQYSTSPQFKHNVKTYVFSNGNKRKAVIKVPFSEKKYYFRICSYKVVNGKKWYSGWRKL